jgi:hypothetical protein
MIEHTKLYGIAKAVSKAWKENKAKGRPVRSRRSVNSALKSNATL